jgi:hypothetical protein
MLIQWTCILTLRAPDPAVSELAGRGKSVLAKSHLATVVTSAGESPTPVDANCGRGATSVCRRRRDTPACEGWSRIGK